jgi:hypothetical protein
MSIFGEKRSSGKNQFAYFPYISLLCEVREPNLMELNLSELTLIYLTEFTAINNLVVMEHNPNPQFSK